MERVSASDELPPASGPLRGVKVLDLGVVIAGPLVGCYFGDLGADVVKVERPGGDPSRATGRQAKGASLIWKYVGRNKRTLAIDFASEEGRETVLDLVREADIVIENFRPGTLEKWGLGWDDLRKVNPGLIMVRISGFGQEGPYRKRPGFGTIAESMAGFTGLNGWPDGPPTLSPIALADTYAAMAASISALAALHRRHVSGEGELIDVSLIEPLFSCLSPQFIDYSVFGVEPKRAGSRLEFASPRGAYECKDGKWFAISGATPVTAQRIFEATGNSEFASDPRFSTNAARMENAELIDKIIQEWASTITRDEALEKLNETGAPVGPVYTMQDIIDDEHFKMRPIYVDVDDPELGQVRMPNVFAKLANNPGSIRFAGRQVDADRESILREWLGEKFDSGNKAAKAE
ncbi:CaiB/BaiF CoA transferase family protein [Hyphococcus luteus]|uniref:CoA transferase n=1 Tax=Hyphococcus luteus TaxID=2058213 RepID=A0A2S7K565_9PROT|nr:CoA transferase [Marinicaulis flavus]PQA87654.1 CoA transferase [Marinicaulis flavus]